MNHQDMRGRRSTFHRTPTPARHGAEEDEYDDVWPARLPTSTRRYTQISTQQEAMTQQPRKRLVNVYDLPPGIPPRRSAATTQGTVVPALPQGPPAYRRLPAPPSQRLRFHWLLLVGVGMLVMFALWVVGNVLVTLGSTQLDDWHYGRPRTFQIDARVGHNDDVTPSHFIALNLNRHVIIIELPGGDATKAKVYNGPTLFGEGQDLTPVTLSFKDVNGDGKPEMLVHIQNQTLVFLNDGTQFRPMRPGEHVTL